MRFFFIVLLMTNVPIGASAKEERLEDYAKGIELKTEYEAPFYKVILPEQVYRYTRKKKLNDIRVFNNNKEPVPHIIRQLNDEGLVEKKSQFLPFFPIMSESLQFGDASFDITISKDGSLIQIQSDKERKIHQNRPGYYLIDASKIDKSIGSLDIKLVEDKRNYASTIKLEYSDDLNNWETLVAKATLTNLNYGGFSLKNTRVELPKRNFKYIRFSWLDEDFGLNISSINANLTAKSLSENRYWSSISPIATNSGSLTYEFDTSGVFNIEQINIELPEDNTFIDVVIESRLTNDVDWRQRTDGQFFRLNYQGKQISNAPYNVSNNRDRFWRITLRSSDGIGDKKPLLKYAWRPDELYFLARGEAPFVLAFGNANSLTKNRSTPNLLKIMEQDSNNNMIANAVPGKEYLLKGEAALIIKKELPWQRILLWCTLVSGVLVIAVMVIRLSKQI